MSSTGSTKPAPPSGLLDLPNELLVSILEQLPSDQLLELASLSRRLHVLSLSMCLCRRGIVAGCGKHSACDITVSASSFSAALPLLRKSLFVESIAHLTCEFPSYDSGVLHDVLSLTRLVSRMSTVDGATLVFRGVYLLPSGVSIRKWTIAYAHLLQLLTKKSCNRIAVLHGDAPARSFVRGDDLDKTLSGKPSLTSRSLAVFRGMKNQLLTERLVFGNFFDAISIRSGQGARAIFPLDALNHSGLTHLRLEFVGLPREAWAAVLRGMTLPNLTDLSISFSCGGPGFLDFLLRHPSITALTLRLFDSFKTPPLPPGDLLPNLTTIKADIRAVAYLTRAKLARLETVITFIHVHHPHFPSDFEDLDRVFARFTRKTGITFRLDISMSFDEEYTEDLDSENSHEGGNDESKQWRQLVKSVAFNTGLCDNVLKSPHKREIVPRWLGEHFPNLEEVKVGRDCGSLRCDYHWINPRDQLVFENAIRDTCRAVKTIVTAGRD